MIQRLYSIAANTFTESIRQPIFLVVLGLGIFALIVSLFLGAYTFDNDDVILIEFCLSTIFVGGVVLCGLLAPGVLAREIENKTVLTVISKPIGRPVFILGKYLGVLGEVFVAFWIWSLVSLMLVRHEVMSTASDHMDGPVVFFGFGALFAAIAVAVWGNFFYNWVFTSRMVAFFTVFLTIGYMLVLLIGKDWSLQSITHEFTKTLKDDRATLMQVVIAELLVFQGLTILCAIAIACSTRLGWLQTLMICMGVYLVGIVSDWFFGRYESANPLAWVAYRVTPNVSNFFVADALSQQTPITADYFVLVSLYAACFTGAALCIAIALFQTRETG